MTPEEEKLIKRREANARYAAKNREKIRAKNRAWLKANPEKHREAAKRYRQRNPELVRAWKNAWSAANPEKARARSASWKAANYERSLAAGAKYREENVAKIREYDVLRRANTDRATPAWANRFFIDEIYRLARLRTKVTGIHWHVDHIVPIQSPIVCGLHVEHNLRVIPGVENKRKGNRHWPDMPT